MPTSKKYQTIDVENHENVHELSMSASGETLERLLPPDAYYY